MGAASAQELLKPLAHLISLAHLHVELGDNKIGAAGAQKLLKPLTHLVSLVQLHVGL